LLFGALPAWLLTYLVHSTLFFLLVHGLEKFGLPLSLRLREASWRVVIFGALASSLAQTLWASEPWMGRHAFEVPVAAAPSESSPPESSSAGDFAAQTSVPAPRSEARTARAPRPPREKLSAAPSAPPTPSRRGLLLASLKQLPWKAVTLLALVLFVVLGLPRIRLRAWLGRREPLLEGPARRELEALATGKPPRLTVSERLLGPVTLGMLRPEICLPRRALEGLDPGLLRAMLAHELAHLARRDPLWFALCDAARRLLWFQPLIRRAQTRLVEIAELSCDQWAARRTGDPLALASCLAEVAGWLHGEGRSSSLACAMARPGSGLETRVRRLLAIHANSPRRESRRTTAWLAALVATLGATASLPALALRAPTRLAPIEVRPDPLQSAGEELRSSLRLLRERINDLHAMPLTTTESERLRELEARASELHLRCTALETALETATRTGTVPAPPEETR
jgi:beta-lactamase regulating signal transducer with metallopeptidase domain